MKINESQKGFALALGTISYYEFSRLNVPNSQFGDASFRRLLKDVSTGLYFDGKDGWTSDESAALDFKDSQEAIKAFQKLNKATLHLVLKFPDSRMDVSHPLGQPKPPGLRLGPEAPLIISTFLPAAVQAVHLVGRMIA